MSETARTTTVLNVRMDKDLHKAFLETCKQNNRNASIIVRDAIMEYVKKNAQGSLKP